MVSNMGICPNCGKSEGKIGDMCPEKFCASRGYHFIPRKWYNASLEFTRRKGKPLDPMLGRMVANHLLIGKLGAGGMGAIYLALQRPLDREVALKLISGMDLNDTAAARFEREAKSMAALEHPNIVKLYDYGMGKVGGDASDPSVFKVPYIAMEYVRHGKTMGLRLDEVRQANNGRIPGDVVLRISTQVLNALAEAHSMGLIHRDMKPDNIMITQVRGNPFLVKVLDFGLAKAVSDVSGFSVDVTHTGQILGTPMYMAPEQAIHAKQSELDGRVDLYAVGVMLYEIFTGRRPFDGDSGLAILMCKTDPDHRPMKFPEAIALPRPLRMFLAKGMALVPDQRFQTAEEMRDAMNKVLAGKQITGQGLAVDPDQRFQTAEEMRDVMDKVLAVDPGSPSRQRPLTPPTPSKEIRDAATLSIGPDTASNSMLETFTEGPFQRRRPWLYFVGPVAVGVLIAVLYATFSGGSKAPAKAGQKGIVPPMPKKQVAARTVPEKSPEKIVSHAVLQPTTPKKKKPSVVTKMVMVKTTPRGALVTIDGRPMGKAPLTWPIRIKKEDDANRQVTLHAEYQGYKSMTLHKRLADIVKQGSVQIALKKKKKQQSKQPQKRHQKKRHGKKVDLGIPLI